MTDPVRQEVIATAHTVVVKVGTNVLTDSSGRLDRNRVHSLADQVQRLRVLGRKVVLVSSGAIGAGVGRLGLGKRPTDLRQLQACAAVGQNFLMQSYQEAFDKHGVHVGQILLIATDFDSRVRYLNVRNTIATLFEYQCVPIINENDTVSVAEIRFGDNDHLAAMVTNSLQAPLLVLLTNVDGLYTGDPNSDPAARLVSTVPFIDRSVMDQAGTSKSILGTGGMRSKLRAARLVTVAGESVIMANGSRDGVLDEIFAAGPVGTLFLPHGSTVTARKRWLGFTARPMGELHVDAGAYRAVFENGKSLLAVGIVRVMGEFGRGAVVSLHRPDGSEFARGLCNFSAADVRKIIGQNTEVIARTLGKLTYDEVIHRDQLVITSE